MAKHHGENKELFKHLIKEGIKFLAQREEKQAFRTFEQALQISPEKVVSNVAKYGNTSAASIPIALNEAVRSGKIQAGNTIATSGFGAGLSWGAAIFKWGKS